MAWNFLQDRICLQNSLGGGGGGWTFFSSKSKSFSQSQISMTVKLCKMATLKKDHKLFFKTNYRLMQVRSIAECSPLQYFLPSLSYHLSLRSLFCLFLSGRFTQILLFVYCIMRCSYGMVYMILFMFISVHFKVYYLMYRCYGN